MLFKNTMRPAYATAGSDGFSKPERTKINNNYATFSEGQSASEDFGSFGGGSSEPARRVNRTSSAPRAPKRKSSRPSSGIPAKTILIVAAAVVALVLLIIMVVAIFNAPQKEIKLEDNAYFAYSDTEGKYYVVANGKVMDHVFDGEVTLTPSADYSFAYVFESLTSDNGSYTKVYILEGTKLKSIELKADQIVKISPYEPGIIYKRGTKFWHYSDYKNTVHTSITELTSADGFQISGDGTTVIYTVDSTKAEGYTELRYFRDGSNKTIGPYGFVPVNISNDGKYVYGTNESGALFYIEVKKDGEVVKNKDDKEYTSITSASYGPFGDITGMNVDGDEIIFYTESEKGISTYLYKIGDDEPVQIAEGLFTPVSSVREVVCPDTFIGGYFECVKDVTETDGTTSTKTMTYYLDKKEGAIRVADTVGQFSPEGDYFYYTDEYKDLIRVSLGSKDFEKNSKAVYGGVSDFAVIEKGDVYVMVPEVTVGIIAFLDASTGKSIIISQDAGIDSMQLSANSVYFSELTEEGEVKIYASTSGSSKEAVTFKSAELTSTPIMSIGLGMKGYATFTDESGVTLLYYTSNGEKFSLIANGCIVNGSGSNTGTEKPTEAPEDEEEE